MGYDSSKWGDLVSSYQCMSKFWKLDACDAVFTDRKLS